MTRDDWYKKEVWLQWQGPSLSFAVAQELFSSHAIDTGSRLLLNSLRGEQCPDRGTALDYGCGYGVLGLAWKKLKPAWNVCLVDRDALAVEFAAWNAERLGFAPGSGVECAVGLGAEGGPPEGFDLILWNVPGKAGESVVRRLAGDIGDALVGNGLAALVVVNPLAGALRSVYEARPDLSIGVDAAFAEHTILHIKKNTPDVTAGTRIAPFERGVFDRDPRTFPAPTGPYTLTPVIGLPEYESHSHQTTLTLSGVDKLPRSPHSAVLIFGCGQGHIPVAVHVMHGVTRFILVDRDLLALEASSRALLAAGVVEDRVTRFARSAIGSYGSDMRPIDMAFVRLDDQQRPAVMTALVEDLAALAPPGLTVVVGGGSTSVSRFLGLVAKQRGWKLGSRSRRHGASAAILTLRQERA